MARCPKRSASTAVFIIFSLVELLRSAVPASAHPSDFETLTLDLLMGPEGLERIDAAVVAGTTYEPFATSEVKRDVATHVLDALHVPLDAVDINADMSDLYHEVGFVVHFDEPLPGSETPLSLDTTDLQVIAAEQGLAHLKLSVCGVSEGAEASEGVPSEGAESSEEVLSELDVQADKEGRRSVGLDREACEVWVLGPADQPVSITVTPSPQVSDPDATTARRSSGMPAWVTVTIAVAAGAGLAAIVGLRRRRPSPPPSSDR